MEKLRKFFFPTLPSRAVLVGKDAFGLKRGDDVCFISLNRRLDVTLLALDGGGDKSNLFKLPPIDLLCIFVILAGEATLKLFTLVEFLTALR
jgi:hypothetical protein